MTDYTTIPDETFDPLRPVLGSTHLAMHKNLAAMCEGAANAPRINLSEALIAPVAGDEYTILTLRDEATSVLGNATEVYWGSNSAGKVSNLVKESRGPNGAFVLRGGSIRISCQIKSSLFDGLASVVISKNNTIMTERGTTSTSYFTKTYDFSVSPGDILCVQTKNSKNDASTSIRYLKILSSTPAYGAVI
jgi:hypothetical protein